MKAGLVGLAGLWLLTATPAMAEIYKCRLAGGQVEISNAPCPRGSATLTARPDETVPEASRQQAERDVERMRGFVDQREASQRAESEAERQAPRQTASSQPGRHYGDSAACLQQLSQQVLEAAQRAALEGECRSLVPPPGTTQSPVYVPAYGPVYQPSHRPDAYPRTGPEMPRHLPSPPRSTPPEAPSVIICPPASKNCKR
jgi:hypothetical protein